MTLNLTAWAAAFFMAASMFGQTVALRLMLLLAGTGLAAIAVARDRNIQRLPPIWIPFAAWAAWAVLSLAWSIEPERSLKELRNEVGYAALALWLCFVGAQARAAVRIFLPVLAAGAVAVCAVALYNFQLGLKQYVSGWHGGPGDHSSALLTLMPCVVMAGWYAAGHGRLRRAVWLSAAVAALLFASAYATLNRTVWLGFAVQFTLLGSLLLLRGPPLGKRARLTAVAIGIALIAGAAGMMLSVQEERETIGARTIQADTRLALWPHIVAHIAERPWTGYGFGRGLLRESLGKKLGALDTHLWHAHNLFLEALVQTGLPGLILLLWVLGVTLRLGWRLAREPDAGAAACGMALIAVVAGMVARNMTDSLLVRQNALLYWSVVGVLLAGEARSRLFRDSHIRESST
jgi:O-antigen ligase